MENLYLILVIILAILACGDLIVGVSNDAVNFLNSAVGSKAISMKTILKYNLFTHIRFDQYFCQPYELLNPSIPKAKE